MTQPPNEIAVVIPCYRVRKQILSVLDSIGPEVHRIYVVDDCCPDGSGNLVERECKDPRVFVKRHTVNQGVGGSVMTGYLAAIQDGVKIVVKIDGDGQMDPSLIPAFVEPIMSGEADYTKGNRFYELESLASMPRIRIFGNATLSFLNKFSTGYWDIFDPTNGFTAIHVEVLRNLPLNKISRRYLFETDLLFRLNILRAMVVDIPMVSKYGGEVSGLKIGRVAPALLRLHSVNFFKRVFYNYYLRDMSIASFELPLGVLMLAFGVIFGAGNWSASTSGDTPASAGTVMLSALPIIVGIQLLLAFFGYDISNVPKRPFHRNFRGIKNAKTSQGVIRGV